MRPQAIKPHALKSLALAVGVAAALPALALTQGNGDLGQRFVSGGVTSDEVAMIKSEKSQFPLSILTVAQGTGAYLADVHVRITDAHSQQVLDTTMDGPYLLVDLPAGRYQVEATLGSTVRTTTIALRGNDHRQTAFYFDTHDQVETPTTATHEASDQADQATGVVSEGEFTTTSTQ
jgi:hypothetical protein